MTSDVTIHSVANLSPVLVANRGEVALRVFRTCADLQLESVAVYSEADTNGPWLSRANHAFLLGPGPASESYLNVDRVIEVIKQSGAKSVHPGYGFLSENADFAEAMEEAGVTWIGPPPASIRAMGDKLSAREVAVKVNCPIVPGIMEPTTDVAEIKAFAGKYGYPLVIKAAYGGGGRGMKVVRKESQLLDSLESAQREAVAAFGRGEVYVERFLENPRHIEVQILSDAHGNVVYLGDRDCSIQRRHQKLVEECPAPNLSDETRKSMGEAAVRVAKEVGYVGVGTAEFLYENGEFYFLEMNTRLQVEHPVTEEVYGLDLVEWQLRASNGEKLPFQQEDLVPQGHTIEVRINAENVGMGFVPSPGLITNWIPPQGPGVRVDAVGTSNWEIPRIYDSLIGKVIVTGRTREQARRRLIRALNEMVIEGIPTTLDFFAVALKHPDFIAGNVSTNDVENKWDLSAIEAAALPALSGETAPKQKVIVEVGGKRLEVNVRGLLGATPSSAKRRTRSRGPAIAASGNDVTAPMQGTVIKIAVEEGQEVSAGQTVIILEAMKMENAIKAPHDGIVTTISVTQNDTVNTGDILVTVEKSDS